MHWILALPVTRWLFWVWCWLAGLYGAVVVLMAVGTRGGGGLMDWGWSYLWFLPIGALVWTCGALLIYALAASFAHASGRGQHHRPTS